ncbi:hypothetical protein ACFQ7M_38115 [Streptomyces massasporeus]
MPARFWAERTSGHVEQPGHELKRRAAFVGGRHESRETLAPAHQLVVGSDPLQERMREGPCFDTAHSSHRERVLRIADLTGAQQRRPAHDLQARKLG